MAASAALANGYKLHIVLPGSRAAFLQDIGRNRCNKTVEAARGELESTRRLNPVLQFDRLLTHAERILELDRDDASSDEAAFTLSDYARAGSVILDHSDLVLVAVHDEPCPALGGTRWVEQRAEEMDLTVIHVPVEQPFDAELIWTDKGRREQRRLFRAATEETDQAIFEAALDIRLLGEPFDLSKTILGWLERRMIAQLDPEYNANIWDKRWQLESSAALTNYDLGRAPQQIDDDLKAIKVWADCRASAMAELVRGSFIIAALLGVVAVFGALLGFLFPSQVPAYAGKALELVCLLLIYEIIWRSRRYDWRSQWLSLRQLERHIEQAAWLALFGGGHIYATPAHLSQFERDHVARWTRAYFRAVMRNSSFPTACITSDYLKTAHALVLHNLVVEQIEYFQTEAPFQYKSDKFLERSIKVCVIIAGAATAAYLIPPTQWVMHQVLGEAAPGRIVPVLGALLPAAAAALAAIRHHGEYAQIAARYEGASAALQMIHAQLAARLPNHRRDFSPPPLRSASLASMVGEATDILIQEVQGWRAILQKKEIEPT
jgi:hypothetical protein